jgi:hypothetical protein
LAVNWPLDPSELSGLFIKNPLQDIKIKDKSKDQVEDLKI